MFTYIKLVRLWLRLRKVIDRYRVSDMNWVGNRVMDRNRVRDGKEDINRVRIKWQFTIETLTINMFNFVLIT